MTQTKEPMPVFAESWQAAVDKFGDKDCLIYDGISGGEERRFTFNEIDVRANRLVRGLENDYGIECGDCIVVVADSRPDLFVLSIACQKKGVVFIPLATDLMRGDLDKLVERYAPKLLVSEGAYDYKGPERTSIRTSRTSMRMSLRGSSKRDSLLRASMKVSSFLIGMQGDSVASSDSVFEERKKNSTPSLASKRLVSFAISLPPYRQGGSKLERMATDDSLSGAPVEITATLDGPSVIFSTSGSTGLPKGVVYSGTVSACYGIFCTPLATKFLGGKPLFDVRDDDKYIITVPLRGISGTLYPLMFAAAGVTNVMVDTFPDGPKEWAPLIDKHRVTCINLFGASMNQFQQQFPSKTFESIRLVTYGGSTFSPALVQASLHQFPNGNFKQGYGSTEVYPVSGLSDEYHKREKPLSQRDTEIMTSAGKVSSMCDMFLEDPNKPGSGEPPIDGIGQICAKTPFVMSGYFKDEEQTKQAMPDREYMRTGDLGKLDEEGFLTIVGRVKDIIPTQSGRMVAPRDIEDMLYAHPAVGQALVCGAMHPSGTGEAVFAYITPKVDEKLTAAGIREHLVSKEMPEWQMPDSIQILDEAMPMISGKLGRKLIARKSHMGKQAVRQLMGSNMPLANKTRAVVPMSWVRQGINFFETLDVDDSGYLDIEEMQHVFGEEVAESFAEMSELGESVHISLDEWVESLAFMDPETRAGFLMLIGSIVAAHLRLASASKNSKLVKKLETACYFTQ